MPFRLGGNSLAAPARVFRGLLLRNIHRRVERKRNQIEHSAPVPVAANTLPEVLRLSSCRAYIVNILIICDLEAVDFERGDFDLVLRQLVVPREMVAGAKGCNPGGDFYHFFSHPPPATRHPP